MIDNLVLSAAQKVLALQVEMQKLPQVDLSVSHHFGGGIYARELFIPKGVTLTGKVHKFENMNILTKGKMLIYTGDESRVLEAPAIVVAAAGSKKAGVALEDSIWVTLCSTDETDPEVIEAEFTLDDMTLLETQHPLELEGN